LLKKINRNCNENRKQNFYNSDLNSKDSSVTPTTIRHKKTSLGWQRKWHNWWSLAWSDASYRYVIWAIEPALLIFL